jgi:mannosyl-glycoprotein endo-beta-N-acetylglucosaminidase
MRNYTKRLLTFSLSVTLLLQLATPALASTELSNNAITNSEETLETVINNEENQVKDDSNVSLEDDEDSIKLENEDNKAVFDENAEEPENIEDDEDSAEVEETKEDLDLDKGTKEDLESDKAVKEKTISKETKDSSIESKEIDEVDNDTTEPEEEKNVKITITSQTTYKGIALKNPTYIYKEPSTSKGTWKSYAQGSILKYQSYSDDWYQATVYVNGKRQTGYIHKSHVENVIDDTKQEEVIGIALNNPTTVYQRASTNSDSLKRYDQGSILKFKTFSNDWYIATVYVNGKKKTGYIHKSHIERVDTSKQVDYRGIALMNPTKIFQKASTNAATWKTYEQGTVLKYQSFSKDWYQATVYVNGEKKTGYIHKSHVENGETSNQENYTGVALKNQTRVYKQASTNLGVWKTYNKGTILKYRSFSQNYYEATVYVNGQRKTGYIFKSDVENAVKNQERLEGIGLNDPTTIYQSASTSSKSLKTYKAGTKLIFRTFTSEWFEATVYIDGQKHTGYIHKSHVDEMVEKPGESIQVLAKNVITHAYSGPSRSYEVLKSYSKFSILKVKTLSKNWFEAAVYVDGEKNTAYFNVNDVSVNDVIETKIYNITFKEFVDLQMKYSSPKADGKGEIPATREQVEYYANPENFKPGTPDYFQFLILNSTAGLDIDDLNNYLNDKGSLKGQGKAFIDAAKKYGINEVYLLSHALHETGNGTSPLSQGIPVDIEGNVIRDNKGNINYDKNHPNYHTTVYNFFGYGAYDNDAINSGAKYAFDQGWDTKYKAIVGGAASIGKNYIHNGQNTLYKMRWNVDQAVNEGTVWKQYATHVQWATIQTKNIYKIYNSLTNYILAFEVPKFKE